MTWIQGISYCGMLIFGTHALIEYQVYGIGSMEVGTFYALCTVYLNVGTYTGQLSGVFVNMPKAVVSLREITALLNQTDQRFQRRQALRWTGMADHLDSEVHLHLRRHDKGISFEDGVCFLRPPTNKVGSTFAELKLKALVLP